MYSTCLFCHSRLGVNDIIERLPVGRRVAFDLARGRLWVICQGCERWNLVPFEERWEVAEDCERRFHATARRYSTRNIGLAVLPAGVELVRIGAASRREMAAWRFGDQFGRRRRRTLLTLGTSALDHWYRRRRVVALVSIGGGDRAFVRRHHLRHTRILAGGPWGDTWGLSVSYSDGAVVLEGHEALRFAGVLLATINRTGATRWEVEFAVEMLERHGDATHCFRYAAHRPEHDRFWLARLPLEVRLALEMAAHEEVERRALEGELMSLKRAWREAERIAAIADDLLLPPWVEEYVRAHRANRLAWI